MRKTSGLISVAAAVAAAFLLAGSGAARGQVWFDGSALLPHGSLSFRVGSPFDPVGSFVPYGHPVRFRPRYGYGFYAPARDCSFHRFRRAHFVPVRRFHRRSLVVNRPFVVFERPFFPRHFPRHHHRRWPW